MVKNMETQTPQQENQPLPMFRRDLQLFHGPDDADGSPTFNLFDPVKSQYYKLNWSQATILQSLKPGITLKQLMESVKDSTTLLIVPEDIQNFFVEAAKMGLLEMTRDSRQLAEEHEKKQIGWLQTFFLYYLFFRIPLVNPDRFLTRTLAYVKPFLSSTALLIYAGITAWGFLLLLTRWDEFFHTFTYFFNWTGAIAYAGGIFIAKIFHEFAHAYTGKKYGLRIPTMGVAFLVLFPVLYTDATDAWKLASRKKRMAITAAGVIAELTIAGLATIGWAFSSPGYFQSICFVLASLNWVSTLLININPAMRFDGYYMLSDLLGVENLSDRAFAWFRREMYRIFFGYTMNDPEPQMPRSKKRLLVVYAIYTFIYRLFLYTAVALFVYFKFTKILGIILFAVEIIVFFLWPVWYEISIYRTIRSHIKWNRRLYTTLTAVALFAVWGVLPWPHTLHFEAITRPEDGRTLYAPVEGQISDIRVERGSKVEQGELLFQISSPKNEQRMQFLERAKEVAKKKLEIAQLDTEARTHYLERQGEFARINSELEGLRGLVQRQNITAPINGTVYALDDYLRDGVFVKKDEVLAQIASSNRKEVMTFVPERDLSYWHVGQKVQFRTENRLQTASGVVKEIGPSRLHDLNYPQLAAQNKGTLPTVQDPNSRALLLVESYYPVLVELDGHEPIRLNETGQVLLKGPWTSYVGRFLGWFGSVLWRESGV